MAAITDRLAWMLSFDDDTLEPSLLNTPMKGGTEEKHVKGEGVLWHLSPSNQFLWNKIVKTKLKAFTVNIS